MPVMVTWQVKEARRRCWNGEAAKDVAKTMGLPYDALYAAVRGNTWSNITEPRPVPVGHLNKSRGVRTSNRRRQCENCRKMVQQTKLGRCSGCYNYLKTHGHDKDIATWVNGIHKRKPISERLVTHLYEKYCEGASIKQLSNESGICSETLRRRFCDRGYKMRPQGARRKLTAALVVQARRLANEEGIGTEKLAEQWGIPYQTLYSAVAGKTWQTTGGPLPKNVVNQAKKPPCSRCDLLMDHPSGLCAYCREK